MILKTLPSLFITLALISGCQKPDESNTESSAEPLQTVIQYSDFDPDMTETLTRCGVDAAEFDRLLALDQKAFDQDFQGGWRTVGYQDNCDGAAAQLLISYIAKYDIAPHNGNNVMFWHVGQMLASEGQTERAIDYFELAHDKETVDRSHERQWSIYAEGTIAFLNKDKAGLNAAIAELSTYEVSEDEKTKVKKMLAENPNMSFPEGYPEKPLNLIALEGLMRCFDQPYSQAYGKCSTD